MKQTNESSFLGTVAKFAARIGLTAATTTGAIAEAGQVIHGVNARNNGANVELLIDTVENGQTLVLQSLEDSRKKVSEDLRKLSENINILGDFFPTEEKKNDFLDNYATVVRHLGVEYLDEDGKDSFQTLSQLRGNLLELQEILKQKGSSQEILLHVAMAIVSLGGLMYFNSSIKRK